jgi:alpha-L-fucosidase
MAEQDVRYTAQDIRYTAKGETLYALCLGAPAEPFVLEATKFLYPGEISGVSLLGSDAPVDWTLTPDGLRLVPPAEAPSAIACVFKITREHPFAPAA